MTGVTREMLVEENAFLADQVIRMSDEASDLAARISKTADKLGALRALANRGAKVDPGEILKILDDPRYLT